jgi:hypothetical protein
MLVGGAGFAAKMLVGVAAGANEGVAAGAGEGVAAGAGEGVAFVSNTNPVKGAGSGMGKVCVAWETFSRVSAYWGRFTASELGTGCAKDLIRTES